MAVPDDRAAAQPAAPAPSAPGSCSTTTSSSPPRFSATRCAGGRELAPVRVGDGALALRGDPSCSAAGHRRAGPGPRTAPATPPPPRCRPPAAAGAEQLGHPAARPGHRHVEDSAAPARRAGGGGDRARRRGTPQAGASRPGAAVRPPSAAAPRSPLRPAYPPPRLDLRLLECDAPSRLRTSVRPSLLAESSRSHDVAASGRTGSHRRAARSVAPPRQPAAPDTQR